MCIHWIADVIYLHFLNLGIEIHLNTDVLRVSQHIERISQLPYIIVTVWM